MEAVTQASLLDAIRAALEAQPVPNDAMTTSELSAQTGLAIAKLRRILRALEIAGRVEVVQVRRPGLGRLAWAPGYRFKGAAGAGLQDR